MDDLINPVGDYGDAAAGTPMMAYVKLAADGYVAWLGTTREEGAVPVVAPEDIDYGCLGAYLIVDGELVLDSGRADALRAEREAQAIVAVENARRQEQAVSGAAIMFVLMAQAEEIDEVTIAEHAGLFAVWDEYWTGKAGTILWDEGALYRSIHDVGVGQNTKPSETPAMWTRIGNPAEEYPEWVQPIGAHDAYGVGAKTTHKGKRWVNTYGDGNIWEPGVFGWEEVT